MPRKLTRGEFVEKARRVHGDKYDYSEVEYKPYNAKICIICPIHGKFDQGGSGHLNGQGCRLCANERTRKRQIRFTTDAFIQKCKKVHNNKYQYNNVKYTIGTDKIEIICPSHGVFHQTAGQHVKGEGCLKCSLERAWKARRLTADDFIQRSKRIHKDKYDYSQVVYSNANSKVKIICPVHGIFSQKAMSHLCGFGCRRCGLESMFASTTSNAKEFISKSQKIHGKDKYDYSKVEYKNGQTKVKIICHEHGVFCQKPNGHLRGEGCRKCYDKRQSEERSFDTAQFVANAKKIHGDKYDYSKVEYINSKTKVKIKCSKHGYFWMEPRTHVNTECDCPSCVLVNETKVGEILKKHFVGWDIQRHKKIWDSYKNYSRRRMCDFFMVSDMFGIKVIVEYDGVQHFQPTRWRPHMTDEVMHKQFKQQQKIDALDKEFCQENNIILWRVRYDENKKESILKLKESLGAVV